ncbi:MAG TPA: PAS domain-containing protein [Polyangia bacterium]|jgi:PAS domain S-box-containing protein
MTDETHPQLGREAAKALRAKVADLVLETTAECIWLIDAEARTTFVNRRLADLLGYTEEEMIGQPVFAFVDPTRWPATERNLHQRALGVEDRQELQLVRKDGTRIWILGSANPLFDRDGEYAGALALLGDLTAQKEREERLRSEISALRERLAEARRPVAVEPPSPYREPFRTAIVLGVCGTLVAGVAALTLGGVVRGLLAGSTTPEDPGL